MVLTNLSAEYPWRRRHGEQTVGTVGEGEGADRERGRKGEINRVTWKLTFPYVK